MATVPGPEAGNTRPRGSSDRKEIGRSRSLLESSMSHGLHRFDSCTGPVSSAPSYSLLEKLPVEVINNILSYLVHPRSRLPGLTENESSYDLLGKRRVKNNEDLTSPPDTDRFAADLFSWLSLRHPFNVLALCSRRCHEMIESYCAHLVKSCNRFNLPFAQADRHGPDSVHPSLSSIVYRRLWLQTAPRFCVFCGVTLSTYPHRIFRLLIGCADCFYAQTLSLDEVQYQYHIMDPDLLAAHGVRGSSLRYDWVLRIDVEALALKLYGTRAFHDTRSEGFGKPCSIPNCAFSEEKRRRSPPPRPPENYFHIMSRPRRSRREF